MICVHWPTQNNILRNVIATLLQDIIFTAKPKLGILKLIIL
jgi:hypothetical protein